MADQHPIDHEEPRSRKRRGAFFLLLLLAIFGLLRLSQRRAAHQEQLAADPSAPDTRRPWTDQSVPVEDETREEAPDPAPMAAAQRYAVKWIDRSDGRPMPRQERDLTFTQALDEVRRVSRDTQSVGGLPASAFSGLRVYLQCFCGRDVADPSKPHIAPLDGRLCPYSGSRQTTEPSPVAPSREEQTAPLRAVAA